MLNEEEVKNVARLARIGLTDEEVKGCQKELSSIFDYFEKLKKVKINFKNQNANNLSIKTTREDISKESQRELVESIKSSFIEKENDYLKVKSIIAKQ